MRRFINMVLIWALMFALTVSPATARCYVYRSSYYAYAYRPPCRVVYPACPPCYVVCTPCVPQSGWCRGTTTSPEPRITNRREVEPKPELSADDTLPMPNSPMFDSPDDAPPEPPVVIPTEPGPGEDMPEETPAVEPTVERPAVEKPADDFDALFDSEPKAGTPTAEEPPSAEETEEMEISEPAKSESTESAPVDTPLAEDTDDVLEDLFGSESGSTEKEMPADEQPEPQPIEPSAEELAKDAPSVDAEEDLFGESSEDAPADEPSSDVGLDDLFGSEDAPAKEAAEDEPADDGPTDETETPAEEESAEESSEDDDLFGDGQTSTSMDGRILDGVLSNSSHRTWMDNTGRHTTRGRLVKIVRGQVQILKETGRTTTVPLYRLNRADLAFLHTQILAAQRENLAAQTAQK